MQQAQKKEILKKIKRIDDKSSLLPPRDAEEILMEVLSPLLEEDGYQVIHAGNTGPDYGVDFVAERPEKDGFLSDSIGIEYKHYKAAAVGIDTVHRILGASISSGFNRAMVVTNSRFTYAAREAIRRKAPVQVELMDPDSLRAWVARMEEVEKIDIGLVDVIRKEVSQKLASLIAQDPNYLDEIEWRELERVLAEVFEKIGFGVELTPGSKDGGKDIILRCKVFGKDHIYYIEVKHWRSGQGVGGSAVSNFLNVIINEEISGGLFLSTYGYCNNAFESLTEIQRQRLRFGQQSKVVTLCKTYVKAKSGIWSPPESLVETLYDGTV